MDRSSISPMPPFATGLGLPWDSPVVDPVAALASSRAELGDTFVVDSGDDRYLFVFSPQGVTAFYALPEERASKGMADWRMLRRKVPDELFVGRRTFPHELFGRDDVMTYLANVDAALQDTFDELGDEGEVDVFTLSRRLGHRLGMASWGGPGSARGARFDQLVVDLDQLDGSEAFVHPDAMVEVAAAGHAAERAALASITESIGAAVGELRGSEADHPLFARMATAWTDEPESIRREGIALDVTLVHIASMSNLFAALGWYLVDLVAHPDEYERVRTGDRARAEQCALESIRMAQRSIMMRYVVDDVTIETERDRYEVERGVTIATLLPLTNTTAAPGLDVWDPDRWNRRRLRDTTALGSTELVTAFGHGKHTCPAQPFSLAVMTEAAMQLLEQYDLEAAWQRRPVAVRAQIGGVARAADATIVGYSLR